MKEDLEKKKKVSKLKELAKAVGAGGIKNAVSDETKEKVKEVGNKFASGVKSGIEEIGKKVIEANSKTIGKNAKDLIKKK